MYFIIFKNICVYISICVNIYIVLIKCTSASSTCRVERSSHLRQDGGLCFEIPPWQHQPVKVENHLETVKGKFKKITERRKIKKVKLALVNSEVNRYMDLVIAPFLDTYHRNIQNAFQQLTNKMLTRIKEEINAAIIKKQKIYTELTRLADKLNLPPSCAEERRAIRTIATKHVSMAYHCTEEARTSVTKMGKYAEEMITITKSHMENSLVDAVQVLEGDVLVKNSADKANVSLCLKTLSKDAVALGYDLDLSLTNARRHNEQSCEKLFNCSHKSKRTTDEAVNKLREFLYQCVYA